MDGIERATLRSRAWRVVSERIVVPAALGRSTLVDTAEVLQLGCGAGFETAAIARRYPGWRILGIDLDPDVVELARRRVSASNVRLEVADATRLEWPDASFDVVFAALVWHHIPDWRAATREAARILRRDGTFVLLDVVTPRTDSCGPNPLATGYSYEALLATLAQVGFERHRGRRFDGLAYSLHARRTEPTETVGPHCW
jgi:ubiquinone/menaquinone biosynthesis C-methylase UbiE